MGRFGVLVYVAQKDVAAADFPSKPRRQLSWLQTIIVVATLDVVDDVVGFDEVVDVVVGFAGSACWA